jgi:hypothetical protein
MKTTALFELCLGRVFPIAGFNDDGMLERRVAELLGEFAFKHSIWIELELVEVVAPVTSCKEPRRSPLSVCAGVCRFLASCPGAFVRQGATISWPLLRKPLRDRHPAIDLLEAGTAACVLFPQSGTGGGKSKRRLGEILGGAAHRPSTAPRLTHFGASLMVPAMVTAVRQSLRISRPALG